MDELLSPNPAPNAGSTPVPPSAASAADPVTAAAPEVAPVMEVQTAPVANAVQPVAMAPQDPVAAPAMEPVVEMSSAAPVMPVTMPAAPVAAPSAPAAKAPYDWYAALAFLPPFLFLISLWKASEKPSVQRGAQYGMIFFFVYVAMDLLVRALLFVSPLSLWLVIGLLYLAVRLAFFGVIVYSSWRALNGNIWTIPVLGDLSARLPVTAWFKQVQAMLKKPASPSTPANPSSL